MIQFSIFVDGKQVSAVSEAEGKEISIGRSPGCVIRLPDPAISRLHAAVKYTQNGWVLEKRSSYGGLAVNGQEVENAILQGGEEVVIANFVLRVNVSEREGAGARSGSIEVDPDAAAEAAAAASAKHEAEEAPPPESREKTSTGIRQNDGVYAPSESSRTNIARSPAVGYLRFAPGSANVAEYVLKKDRVVLGRASTCDVVLFEKKASRKHLEIRREGLSFYLKDLGSANGTFVNEKKIDSAELIPGDSIKVGESRFEFSIENKDFFAKRDQFMPVPVSALPEGGIADHALSGEKTRAGQQMAPFGIPTLGGGSTDGLASAPDSAEEEPKSLFVKRWRQFWKLPRLHRLAILFLVAALGPAILFGPDAEQGKKRPPVTRAKDGTIIRRYQDLTKKNRDKVDQAYAEIQKARGEKNYQKMLDNTTVILQLLTEFKDTKMYEAEARRGLEEEEKRAEEEKLRKFQEELGKEVAGLVMKGERVFQQALEDPGKRPELEIVIQEIYTKDPNNSTAQSWQDRIKKKIAQEAEEKDAEEAERRLKEKAEGEFAKLEDLFVRAKYVEALQFAETLPQIGYKGDGFLERVDQKKAEIRHKLASVIDPFLEVAERERSSNGDLVKAKENYAKVLEIDPENEKALIGQEAIRSVLHLRAKRLYAQAILAESVTSLDEARVNLLKCVQVAPDKDPYKRRCEAKLLKYEPFTKEESTP